MHSFKNDYSEGAHPNILKALTETNLSQQNGYGLDEYSEKAANLIRERVQNPNADVHFVSGGTQANFIVIESILRSYESIIAPTTAHIFKDEVGAIEATGHRIDTVECKDGKLTSCDIKSVVNKYWTEHSLKPKMVFITNSTEIGSVYTKKELEDVSSYCKKNGLYLFLDGARLGAALCSKSCDLTLPELSKLVDVFYIGGTKNGALLGEAIVINNDQLKENFRLHLKQRGALLAKGRVLGIQFLELFKDNLYFDLAKQANKMADKLAQGITELGCEFLSKPVSNQLFPILPNNIIDELLKEFHFYKLFSITDDTSAIRLVTSWMTEEFAVDKFVETLKKLKATKSLTPVTK